MGEYFFMKINKIFIISTSFLGQEISLFFKSLKRNKKFNTFFLFQSIKINICRYVSVY